MPFSPKLCTRRSIVAGMLALGFACAFPAFASVPAPAEVKALLPAVAVRPSGTWAVYGTVYNANLQADLKGFKKSCDITLGSHIQYDLRGDLSWPEQLFDIMRQNQADDLDQARKAVADQAAGRKKSSPKAITAIGEVKDERLDTGRVVYIEYMEECPGNPKHPFTILQGGASKGTTFVHFFINLVGSAAEAKAVAADVFARLQKFDVSPLLQAAGKKK